MSALLYLSSKNFIFRIEKYIIVLASLTIITICFLLLIGITNGMRISILNKALKYFGGDIAIQSFVREQDSFKNGDVSILIDRLSKKLGDRGKLSSIRTLYTQQPLAQLFFNGAYIKQRRIIGVDWELERSLLSTFSFHSGGLPIDNDKNAILVSTSVADFLGIAVGDQIDLSITTTNGQQNTHLLTVSAIFDEYSFFGYASYVYRHTLNELIDVDIDYATDLGISVANISQRKNLAQYTHAKLSSEYELLPLLDHKDDRQKHLRQSRVDRVLSILTLDAQVAEITELMNALLLIAYIIIFILLFTTTIGITNTFSLIAMERKQEIGTLRSLGMYRGGVMRLFLGEGTILALGGTLAGLFLGLFVLKTILGEINFSSLPEFEIFLQNGRIPWNLSMISVVAVFFINLCSCMLGSAIAVYKTAQMVPVDALRLE